MSATRSTRWAALCVSALLLSACSTGGDDVHALHELPDDVSVSVYQNRTDFAKRQLEVSVSNDSNRQLTITGLVFDSTQFVSPARWAKDATTIAAGVTADLPVRLPVADCDEDDPKAVVRIEFAVAGDEPASTVVTPIDTFDRLPALFAEDCLQQSVAETVGLAATDELRVTTINGISVAQLDIRVSPTGRAGRVSIDGAAGTTLLAHADPTTGAVVTAPAIGVVVDRTSQESSFTLTLVPNRCDPHAVAEDKRGTVLPFAVTTDDGTSGRIFVAASPSLRAALYDFVGLACALP